jgi:holin-like protein
MMKIIAQCGFLCLVCLTGGYLSRLFPFPMPASVLSMLLLLSLLFFKAVDPASLAESTDVLLGNMAFFFLPSGVGILAHLETFRSDALALLAICCMTTLLTFAASAFAVVIVTRMQRRIREALK